MSKQFLRYKDTGDNLLLRLLSLAWMLLAAVIVLAALSLGVARMLFTATDRFSQQVEAQVGAYIGLPVTVERLEAAWRGIRPELKLQGVEVLSMPGGEVLMQVREIRVVLDLAASLMQRKLQPAGIALVGTRLPLERKPGGGIHMAGFPVVENAPDLVSLVLGQRRFYLLDVDLEWDDPADDRPALQLEQVRLRLINDGYHRLLRLTGTPSDGLGTAFELMADMKWDPRQPARAGGELYAQVTGARLEDWDGLGFFDPVGVRGKADLKSWFQVYQGELLEIQNDIAVKDLVWKQDSGDSEPLHFADSLQGLIAWQRDAGGWSISGDGLTVRRGGETWPETGFRMRFDGPEEGLSQRVALSLDEVALDAVLPLIKEIELVPDSYRETIAGLDMDGRVRDLRVEVLRDGEALQVQAFSGRLLDLGCKAWDRLPGAAGISGLVRGTPFHGQVKLESHAAELSAPRLFRDRIHLGRVAGDVEWRRSGTSLSVDVPHLKLENKDLKGSSRLRLEIPSAGASPMLDLQVDLERGDIAATGRYLPALRMSPGAVRWLDGALVSGGISSAGVLFHGRIGDFPFDQAQGNLQAQVNVDRAVLDYRTGWPRIDDLDAEVIIRNRSLSVHAAAGKIYDANLIEADAKIEDLTRSGAQIRGAINGPVSDMLSFLQNSPLDAVYGNPLGPVEVGGNGNLSLELDVPLRDKKAKVRVKGGVEFDDNRLHLTQWDLWFRDISGTLDFTEAELSSDKIQARYRNEPVRLRVATDAQGGRRETRLELSGPLGLAKDLREMNLPLLSQRVRGAAPSWNVALTIQRPASPQQQRRIMMEARSDLQGIEVDLPAPLGKAQDARRPFWLRAAFTGKTLEPIVFRYGDEFSGNLETRAVDDRTVLSRGSLQFGAGQARLPDDGVLQVTGYVAELPGMEWIDLMRGSEGDGAVPVLLRDLEVEYLEGFGHAVERVKISTAKSQSGWTAAIDGPSVSGNVEWIKQAQGRNKVKAVMDRMAVVAGPGPGPGEPAGDPAEIPALDIQVQQATYNGIDLGSVVVQASQHDSVLQVDRLEASADWARLEAQGEWRSDVAGQSSNFAFRVYGDDFGKVLDTVGYAGSFSGGILEARLSASWPGSPGDFAPENLAGNLNLEVRKGRLLEVEPGAGRIFGLLSLQALPRRLVGDFGDLFQKGFSYDQIEGNFSLQHGDAFTDDLIIEGPAAQIEISGRTGLRVKDYDQVIRVIPRVRSSLPLAGALAVSPVAGAAIFLADKLLAQPAGTEYRLTGSWDDPVLQRIDAVEIENAFSDETDG